MKWKFGSNKKSRSEMKIWKYKENCTHIQNVLWNNKISKTTIFSLMTMKCKGIMFITSEFDIGVGEGHILTINNITMSHTN